MTPHPEQQAAVRAYSSLSAARPGTQLAISGSGGKSGPGFAGAVESGVDAAPAAVAAQGQSQQKGAANGGRIANGHLHVASQPYRAALATGGAVPVPLPSVKAS